MRKHLNFINEFSVRGILCPFQLHVILIVLASKILLWAWKDKIDDSLEITDSELQSLPLPSQASNGLCILEHLNQIPTCLHAGSWFWDSSWTAVGLWENITWKDQCKHHDLQAPTFLILALDLKGLSDIKDSASCGHFTY